MPPEQNGKKQIFSMEPIEAPLDYPISKNPEKDKMNDNSPVPSTIGRHLCNLRSSLDFYKPYIIY